MYLIPANSKKGKLIFNIFRVIDLIIFLIGILITVILLITIKADSLTLIVIKLAPVIICSMLVMPVPNYHNVLMFLQDLIEFYSNRRIYIWKGWCVMNESED